MADNYTQATLTPDVLLTDELRAVLELTGATLEPADDGKWYAYWEDGISELDDQAWDMRQHPDAAEAADFRERWHGKDISDVLRAVLDGNPGTGLLVIEGAYGCSKMRPGQFGGFGIYVTREQFAFTGSQDIAIQDGRLAVTARVQQWPGAGSRPGGVPGRAETGAAPAVRHDASEDRWFVVVIREPDGKVQHGLSRRQPGPDCPAVRRPVGRANRGRGRRAGQRLER